MPFRKDKNVDDFRNTLRRAFGKMKPAGDFDEVAMAEERRLRRQAVQASFDQMLSPIVRVLKQMLEAQDNVVGVYQDQVACPNPELTFYVGVRLRWIMDHQDGLIHKLEDHDLAVLLTANNAVSVTGGEVNLAVMVGPERALKAVTLEWVRDSDGKVKPLLITDETCADIVQQMISLLITEGKTRIVKGKK